MTKLQISIVFKRLELLQFNLHSIGRRTWNRAGKFFPGVSLSPVYEYDIIENFRGEVVGLFPHRFFFSLAVPNPDLATLLRITGIGCIALY